MNLVDVSAAAGDLAALREALAGALERRDAAIRQAFADGWPIGAIAQAANLTPARIASVLGHPFKRVGRPSTPVARTTSPDG